MLRHNTRKRTRQTTERRTDDSTTTQTKKDKTDTQTVEMNAPVEMDDAGDTNTATAQPDDANSQSSDVSTEPLFPDDNNVTSLVERALEQANRLLAETIEETPARTPNASTNQQASSTTEVDGAQLIMQAQAAIDALFGPSTTDLTHPIVTSTPNRRNVNETDDSVILIDDGPNPIPIPVFRNDQDVIFVAETRAVDRQRITAVVDLCSGDDDVSVVRSAASSVQNVQNVAAGPTPAPASTSLDLSHPSNLSGIVKCPICLELVPNNDIHSTHCGHLYCGPCIKNVIKTRKKCPMCNKGLTLKQIHRIYFQN